MDDEVLKRYGIKRGTSSLIISNPRIGYISPEVLETSAETEAPPSDEAEPSDESSAD